MNLNCFIFTILELLLQLQPFSNYKLKSTEIHFTKATFRGPGK